MEIVFYLLGVITVPIAILVCWGIKRVMRFIIESNGSDGSLDKYIVFHKFVNRAVENSHHRAIYLGNRVFVNRHGFLKFDRKPTREEIKELREIKR